jgi:hypothetical protein
MLGIKMNDQYGQVNPRDLMINRDILCRPLVGEHICTRSQSNYQYLVKKVTWVTDSVLEYKLEKVPSDEMVKFEQDAYLKGYAFIRRDDLKITAVVRVGKVNTGLIVLGSLNNTEELDITEIANVIGLEVPYKVRNE